LKYTLDTFGKIGFGKSFDALTDPLVTFPANFDFAQRSILDFFMNPAWKFFGKPTKYFAACEGLDRYAYSVIAERKMQDYQSMKDLLSKFMQQSDAKGDKLPDQWLRDVVLNFIIAGRDTTGILLTWTFFEISRHPELLSKIQAEIEVIFEGDLPTSETLGKLVYLDKFIKEVLRLHPSVPSTGRWALNDDVFPDGTIIKAGYQIRYLPYYMHRDPKYWERPLVFDPDRWDDPNILKNKFQYIPFHAGPMRCLGEVMAVKEAMCLIVMILQRFVLILDPTHPVGEVFGIVMASTLGVKMFVKAK